jgi:hypothetical protein
MKSWTRENTSRGIVIAGAVALLGVALPVGAMGQQKPFRGEFFLYGDVAVPVGEFQDHVNLGGGGGIGGVLYLNDGGTAALRAEGNFVIYGTDSYTAPLSPTVPFVDVDVRTTNSILSAGLGPQVYLGSGSFRPYIFGTVGFSYFVTETGVSGTNFDEEFASTTNFDDFNLALTGGGGLSIGLREDEVSSLSLDLSVSYQHNGPTEYLTGGSQNLRRLPRGGWTARPILSEANLMTYRAGVSIALR